MHLTCVTISVHTVLLSASLFMHDFVKIHVVFFFIYFVTATTHPLGNLHSAPELCDLMNEVATEIPDKWKEVAIGLGLTASDVKRIETDIPTQKSNLCYIEVFDAWKKRNIKKYTWETLLKTLRTRLVNTPRLATTLECRLTS